MEDQLQEISGLYAKIEELVIQYGLQFLFALLLLGVGLVIGGRVSKVLERFLLKKGIDETLAQFLANVAKGGMAVLVAVMTINQMGFAIGPLIAALSALAFGASFAIQGLVSNLGAGIAIVVLRPFKIGDTVLIKGKFGVVSEIRLMQTLLENEDKEIITIPNHMILGQILVNSQATRIADEVISVSYDSDPRQVREIFQKVFSEIPELKELGELQVGLDQLADYGLNFRLRFKVLSSMYFEQRFVFLEKSFLALREAGVEIPFPRHVVELEKQE